jgi:glycosyltransferase involved in cell wall biosynthesis
MRVVIATVQVPFVRGGAEDLAEGLRDALRDEGHDADIVSIPFKWYPAERILDHILACRLLDLSEANGLPVDRVIALKFPAYLIEHPNKVVWLVHQHRTAYEMWDGENSDLIKFPNGSHVRDAIHHADRHVLPQARGIFTIAGNVSRRLRDYCGLDSRPLYSPPKAAEQFYCDTAEDYLFFPSRLSMIKRQGLVLEALAETKEQVRVRFAGSADNPEYADALCRLARDLRVSDRVEWLGYVSEEEKRRQYASSLGVVYPPIDEDYGYVTLEAMLASKPVVTCSDSGEPVEFVRSGETGIVAPPTPESLANALDEVWAHRERSADWGLAARSSYDTKGISWRAVVESLLS